VKDRRALVAGDADRSAGGARHRMSLEAQLFNDAQDRSI
jgi:hypothetical protein